MASLDDLFGTHRLGPARYSHITTEMRWRLRDGLTDLRNAASDQRMNSRVGSPGGVLDALLGQRRPWEKFLFSQRAPESPKGQAWFPAWGL